VTLCNKFERNAAFSTDNSGETLPVAALGLVASDIWSDEITVGARSSLNSFAGVAPTAGFEQNYKV
jgi:hypothetical protein